MKKPKKNQYNENYKKHGYWEEKINEVTTKGEYEDGKKIGTWHYYNRIKNNHSSMNFLSKNIFSVTEYNTISDSPEERRVYQNTTDNNIGYAKLIYVERYDLFGNISHVTSLNHQHSAIGESFMGELSDILWHKYDIENYINPIDKSELIPEKDYKGRLIQLKDIQGNIVAYTRYNDEDNSIEEYFDMHGNYYHHSANSKCHYRLENIFKMGTISYDINHPRLKDILSPIKYKTIN